MSIDVVQSDSSSFLSRRGFLRAGGLAVGAAGGVVASLDASSHARGRARHCIVILLVGGPSQLETWDPKPDAPAEIRGPFQSIPTSVPSIRVGEQLPRLATQAQRYTIIRTLHHDAPAVHEAGLQLLQTGRLTRTGTAPHFGSVPAREHRPTRSGALPIVVLPTLLGNLGLNVSRGQDGLESTLDSCFTHQIAPTDRERYGKTALGDSCARALQLVETGTRCVVVNMFDTLYDRITWDCHADRHGLNSTLDDYRRTLCPAFDRAFATLLSDLLERGMLEETLVVAMGEMGRTPRLNVHGGRDHWTRCWSIVLAGGGVRGGQVIGASDGVGAEPSDRPIRCDQVAASIQYAMGMPMAPISGLFC